MELAAERVDWSLHPDAENDVAWMARIAREVASVFLPAYSGPFSKHRFTQPQLLSLLCLTRVKNWTFREAEEVVQSQPEVRQALGIRYAPHFTTLQKFGARLPEGMLAQTMAEFIRHLQDTPYKPSGGGAVKTRGSASPGSGSGWPRTGRSSAAWRSPSW